jgi:hypothetical protein
MTARVGGDTWGGLAFFAPDGTCVLGKGKGRYTFRDGTLTLDTGDGGRMGGPVTWVTKDQFTHRAAGVTFTYERDGAATADPPPAAAKSVVGKWKLTIKRSGATQHGEISFLPDGVCVLAGDKLSYTYADGVLTVRLNKGGPLTGRLAWENKDRFTLQLKQVTFTFVRDGAAAAGEKMPPPVGGDKIPPAGTEEKPGKPGEPDRPQTAPDRVLGAWKLTVRTPKGTAHGAVRFRGDGTCLFDGDELPYTFAGGVLTIRMKKGNPLTGRIAWEGEDRFTLQANQLTCTFERDQAAGDDTKVPPVVGDKVPAQPAPAAAGEKPGSPGDAGTPAAPDESKILLLGHWGVRAAFDRAVLPITAVAAATAANANGQQLVTRGTVTMQAAQGQVPSYAAGPGDRLVWKVPGRAPVEFFLTRVEGDWSEGGRHFLFGNHALKYRVVVRDQLDLEVERTRRRVGIFTTNYEIKIRGSLLLQGKKHQVDLGMRGRDYFESDLGGAESYNDSTVTGTIIGPALRLTADETAHFTLVSSKRDVVSFDWRKINNRAEVGGKTYRWQDVFLKKNFKNGKISGADRSPSDWVCQGRVTADGATFATYGKDARAFLEAKTGFIVYQITTPAGTLELERWRAPNQSPDIPL